MKPEQATSSKFAFEGRIVRVRVDSVRLPNGRQASREVVEHDASVVVVPIDTEENVLLVRQYRYAVGEGLLEAPAGGVRPSESPGACAQRELQEEAGYLSNDLRAIGGFWMSPGFCTEYMHVFLAKDLVPSKLQADYDENIEVERVPLSTVPGLIRSGEIKDAKTIASLLMTTCLADNVHASEGGTGD